MRALKSYSFGHPDTLNCVENGELISIRYQFRTQQEVESDPIDCSDWEFDFHDDHVSFRGQRWEFPINTSKLIEIAGKPTSRSDGKLAWAKHGFFAKSDIASGLVKDITFRFLNVEKQNYPSHFFGGTLKISGITIGKEMKKDGWDSLVFPDWVNTNIESDQSLKALLVRPKFVYRDKQLTSLTIGIKTSGVQ